MQYHRAVVLVLLLLLSAGPASAQSMDEQTRALARLQEQVDQLHAQSATPATGIYGHTDVAVVIGHAVVVLGWAFECASGRVDTIEVELDGVIRDVGLANPRAERQDVYNALVGSGACDSAHTPLRTGIVAVLDVRNFDLTVAHSVALRFRNAAGVSKRFNLLGITKFP